jgi:hypothetical protein
MTQKQLLKIVTGFTNGILGKDRNPDSMCFAVCAPLQSYLSLCGIQSELIEGEIHDKEDTYNHFWIKTKDGNIIDPTASQFNQFTGKDMPMIYVGPKPDWYLPSPNQSIQSQEK